VIFHMCMHCYHLQVFDDEPLRKKSSHIPVNYESFLLHLFEEFDATSNKIIINNELLYGHHDDDKCSSRCLGGL
jgi:hypothetical protein